MALIYIVEDDRSIREIETIALNNSGHKVESFETAKVKHIVTQHDAKLELESVPGEGTKIKVIFPVSA